MTSLSKNNQMNASRRILQLLLIVILSTSLGLITTPAFAHAETLSKGIVAQATAPAASDVTMPMYRLYNPNSGEHFYTAVARERDSLEKLGWRYEQIAWESPRSSKTPVYRLYNPNNGDHHYTTSAAERDWLASLGWNYEGVGWYSDDSKRIAVHRLFNPNLQAGSHHYSTSSDEYNWLGSIGWNKEGVGWYAAKGGSPAKKESAESLRKLLGIHEAIYPEFDHGYKGASFQKYIMLHDTEINGSPKNIVDFWLNQREGIATHFVVGKDGSVWQCVGIDRVAWHAGAGNSAALKATLPNGIMNSYSIGIEMIHVGGEGFYPEAQLYALDRLIAYIDAYYGFESTIIDHKMWRSTNSDTSPEFARYLANYRSIRRHA